MAVHWDINEHTKQEVVVLRLAGRGVFIAEDDGALWLRTKQLIGDGYVRVLLNMRGVDYIDSFSIGEIVRGFNAARQAGGRFGVCEMVPRVRGVFVSTKLVDVIPIFETESDGITALAV